MASICCSPPPLPSPRCFSGSGTPRFRAGGTIGLSDVGAAMAKGTRRGPDPGVSTQKHPKTMGMYWNLKFGDKKHLISWNFLGGFCIFSVMAEAYFFEDSPPVAEDLRRSMAQWDDQLLAVRLLEAGGYGINVPYGSIWVFGPRLRELTSNCWCLTSNYWNYLELFRRVSPTKNFSWGIRKCGLDSRFSR